MHNRVVYPMVGHTFYNRAQFEVHKTKMMMIHMQIDLAHTLVLSRNSEPFLKGKARWLGFLYLRGACQAAASTGGLSTIRGVNDNGGEVTTMGGGLGNLPLVVDRANGLSTRGSMTMPTYKT